MSVDVLSATLKLAAEPMFEAPKAEAEPQPPQHHPQPPLQQQQPLDLLLNIIGSQRAADPANDAARRPQQRSRFASGDFPQEYDFSQPAKSWWRYFQKQTDTNTAMCYTCGAVFNRGPKQSTTSLSHHLKMYHRDQFIFIQQAKDDDLKASGKSARKSAAPTATAAKGHRVHAARDEPPERAADEDGAAGESNAAKKSAFNVALIKAVRARPEVYDLKCRSASDEQLSSVWEDIAAELGEDVHVDVIKKRWLQIRDRYRKELKFAIRDNFAYKPKWPYFWDLGFLDDHLKDTEKQGSVRNGLERKRPFDGIGNNNEFRGLLDDQSVGLLNNIFSACARHCSPDRHEADSARSTDSAIASTSEQDADEFEAGRSAPPNAALLTIQQLLQEQHHHHHPPPPPPPPPHVDGLRPPLSAADEPAAKKPRPPRKSTPTRMRPSVVAGEAAERAELFDEKAFDWLEDEDMLFGKIVALRLRALPASTKKQLKIQIEQLFERHSRGAAL